MTQRLDKINKQHNGIGLKPKLEPRHKWAQGPINIKYEQNFKYKYNIKQHY